MQKNIIFIDLNIEKKQLILFDIDDKKRKHTPIFMLDYSNALQYEVNKPLIFRYHDVKYFTFHPLFEKAELYPDYYVIDNDKLRFRFKLEMQLNYKILKCVRVRRFRYIRMQNVTTNVKHF